MTPVPKKKIYCLGIDPPARDPRMAEAVEFGEGDRETARSAREYMQNETARRRAQNGGNFEVVDGNASNAGIGADFELMAEAGYALPRVKDFDALVVNVSTLLDSKNATRTIEKLRLRGFNGPVFFLHDDGLDMDFRYDLKTVTFDRKEAARMNAELQEAQMTLINPRMVDASFPNYHLIYPQNQRDDFFAALESAFTKRASGRGLL